LNDYVNEESKVKKIKKARTHRLKKLLKTKNDLIYDESYDTSKIKWYIKSLNKLVQKILKKAKTTIN